MGSVKISEHFLCHINAFSSILLLHLMLRLSLCTIAVNVQKYWEILTNLLEIARNQKSDELKELHIL